jgi:hypothetical protein
MPSDPNQGVVRSGQLRNKPTIEESGSGNSLWILSDDDDDPVLVVSMLNCLSVLVAQKKHVDEIEKAEREGMADLERIREAGGMGAETGPEYPDYPMRDRMSGDVEPPA